MFTFCKYDEGYKLNQNVKKCHGFIKSRDLIFMMKNLTSKV